MPRSQTATPTPSTLRVRRWRENHPEEDAATRAKEIAERREARKANRVAYVAHRTELLEWRKERNDAARDQADNAHRRFTADDNRICLSDQPVVVIARLLGRSVSSVQSHRALLRKRLREEGQ